MYDGHGAHVSLQEDGFETHDTTNITGRYSYPANEVHPIISLLAYTPPPLSPSSLFPISISHFLLRWLCSYGEATGSTQYF